jgi:hypothetical protein
MVVSVIEGSLSSGWRLTVSGTFGELVGAKGASVRRDGWRREKFPLSRPVVGVEASYSTCTFLLNAREELSRMRPLSISQARSRQKFLPALAKMSRR